MMMRYHLTVNGVPMCEAQDTSLDLGSRPFKCGHAHKSLAKMEATKFARAWTEHDVEVVDGECPFFAELEAKGRKMAQELRRR